MKERALKPHTHFSHAYEAWTGEKWHWEIDGKKNSPMDSNNSEIIAFYIGFMYAKQGQGKIKDIEQTARQLEKQLVNLKKQIDKFKFGETE